MARVIYLMGPSGAGKDSLIEAAREQLDARGCRVARRVITRSAEAVGEEAVAVSVEEFERRLQAGDFAMSWRANGLAYGIGREIDEWLAAGYQVLVNGSRGYLDEARSLYPGMTPILLIVDAGVLRTRLARRGRETLGEIEARTARNVDFVGIDYGMGEPLTQIDNSGSLDNAVSKLLEVVEAHA